ncbi:nucleotidyltransferase domain-containing protein [Roseateles sp.]|uniref:nucleotidyltransferase domain-containing protein n=1 Tax=Roseateles sp. TaxID=1971397 RepID=UPI003BA68550
MAGPQSVSLLVQVLLQPDSSLSWNSTQWELLLQQARRANLLARVGVAFERADLLEQVQEGPRRHFEAIRRVTESQQRAVLWEAQQIHQALRGLKVPVVLLKGAAYALSGLTAAQGRLFADVDILVPRESLDAVEFSLMAEGWQGAHHDEYDQRYYRQWMHEIPPMQHLQRETVIDVHHNILPLTSRIKVDAAALLAHIEPIPGGSGLYRLSKPDMVLHSACHLFLDGEFDKGLRDLVDLDALLREFGQEADFWPQLMQRSHHLGLDRILFYALRYTHRVLKTPGTESPPPQLLAQAPSALQLRLMDALFLRALQPDHPSCADRWTGLARQALYLRAHWMRMPMLMLTRHLLTKAIRKPPEAE